MSVTDTALSACAYCRKQKRKCDKLLPQCSSCQRLGKQCDYPAEKEDNIQWLKERIRVLEDTLAGSSSTSVQRFPSQQPCGVPEVCHTVADSNSQIRQSLVVLGSVRFPSAFFLDVSAFHPMSPILPQPLISIPESLLPDLNSAAASRKILATYFDTIHSWLPIVWKQRIDRQLERSGLQPDAGLALLLASMKLVCNVAPREPHALQTSLYFEVKRYLSLLEDCGCLQINVLQAAMLIATFELGNGMYPAAYLSVGRCARLGQVMGLHNKGSPQARRHPSSWGEAEETRRVWCAALILDRAVNIGSRKRPLASGDFAEDEILPCRTDRWDRGQPSPSQALFVHAVTILELDPFARTCQAAHLVGRVIDHRDDPHLDGQDRFIAAKQLLQTLDSLSEELRPEVDNSDPMAFGVSFCLVISGQMALFDMYACSATNRRVNCAEETEMQAIAMDRFPGITTAVAQFGRALQRYIAIKGASLGALSPLICDCLYQAAATAAWFVNENGNDQMAEARDGLLELLRAINTRWKVAGEYQKIVETVWMRASC